MQKDVEELAMLVDEALKGNDVKDKVQELNGRFNTIKYSFDELN